LRVQRYNIFLIPPNFWATFFQKNIHFLVFCQKIKGNFLKSCPLHLIIYSDSEKSAIAILIAITP